jgi:Cu-Zn family superoxide dismutase
LEAETIIDQLEETTMRNKASQGVYALSLSLMLLLSGCEWADQPTVISRTPVEHQSNHQSNPQVNTHTSASSPAAPVEAAKEPVIGTKRVELIDSKGAKVGTAVLSQVAEGVKLQVEVSGLPPGKHGIHIHQMGVCAVPDFKSAGDHFNPEGKKHGFENPEGYHAGDLLNLEVGSDGTAKADLIDKKVTLLKDKANSLLKPGGTSLVIHEAADDYKTDPSGNSGARIACGVIM